VRVVSIGVDIDALMADPEKDWGRFDSLMSLDKRVVVKN